MRMSRHHMLRRVLRAAQRPGVMLDFHGARATMVALVFWALFLIWAGCVAFLLAVVVR